jgi:dTDP-4-dehydrorhamnose reductase
LKKILVTGSNGLLGQKLVYALLKRKDVQLIATAVGPNRLLQQQGYVYQSMDITNIEEVKKVFSEHLPDVVINTAAMTNVDACETKREECWKLNVTAVENMISVLEEMSVRNPQSIIRNYKPHFIHLSTDFIFDGMKGSSYTEEDKPNPLSYYAESKWASEQVVMKSKLKWAIARTIIVFGIVDNMSRSNIVLWAKDALTKGQNINVVDDQFRSPTLAEDLADGCIRIADKGATGIYNLAGPETFSILELVYRVADFWKLDKSKVNPSKSATLNQPAKRPPYTGLIIDKARKDLGYNPHSFEEGLSLLDAQLKNEK